MFIINLLNWIEGRKEKWSPRKNRSRIPSIAFAGSRRLSSCCRKKEIDSSQGQKSETKHRRLRLKKKVKRFPFLSDLQYAEFAVSLYEKQPHAENAKFEVVQVLGACRTLLRFPHLSTPEFDFGVGDWCHVSFIAKPRNVDGNDTSPFFFFFELSDFGSGELGLQNFTKLKPDDVSGMTHGCGFCPHDTKYSHPSQYIGGSDSVPLDPASQREMARCFKVQLIKARRQQIKSHRQIKFKGVKEPVETCFAPELSDLGYAEMVLGFINDKGNDEKYEIVRISEAYYELLGIPEIDRMAEWCHVSFIAKPKNADSNDASEKLIFAELVNFGTAKYTLNTHSILDPCGSGITYGCGFCPPDEKHPHPADSSKYTAGHWPYSPLGMF